MKAYMYIVRYTAQSALVSICRIQVCCTRIDLNTRLTLSYLLIQRTYLFNCLHVFINLHLHVHYTRIILSVAFCSVIVIILSRPDWLRKIGSTFSGKIHVKDCNITYLLVHYKMLVISMIIIVKKTRLQ